jgi:hypothetical protein
MLAATDPRPWVAAVACPAWLVVAVFAFAVAPAATAPPAVAAVRAVRAAVRVTRCHFFTGISFCLPSHLRPCSFKWNLDDIYLNRQVISIILPTVRLNQL